MSKGQLKPNKKAKCSPLSPCGKAYWKVAINISAGAIN